MDDKNVVLFIDDEEVNLFLFEKRFENDFNVITSSSGADALEKLDKYSNKVKAVISDMRMPEMSGLDFVRQARGQFIGIKYFILTGYSFNVELEEALERKEIEMIFKKPFDYDAIKRAVNEF